MKVSNLLQAIRSRAGFTMIELLVVIAVIGVLAVAVLASIDPIEQINKGRDTRKRSNAAQLINALDRFYAINELYPWNDATYVAALLGTDTTPDTAFPDGTACAAGTFCEVGGPGFDIVTAEWLTALASTSEVKQSFIDQLSDDSSTNTLYVSKALDGDTYICFSPASKQFQLEALDGCESRGASLPGTVGTAGSACPQASYPQQVWADELICLP